jgi:hypothetical protein
MHKRFFQPEFFRWKEPRLRAVKGLPEPGEMRALTVDELKLLGLSVPALITGGKEGTGFALVRKSPWGRDSYDLDSSHIEILRDYWRSPNVLPQNQPRVQLATIG